jgi:hypothetical protein
MSMVDKDWSVMPDGRIVVGCFARRERSVIDFGVALMHPLLVVEVDRENTK